MFEVTRYNGPNDAQAVAEWVRSELSRLEQSFFDLDMIQLKETFVAVPFPRDGMTVFADGTQWNPGAGRGVYTFYGGVWNKLG